MSEVLSNEVSDKIVLACINRLRGASIREIAARLGTPITVEAVATVVRHLAEQRQVRPLGGEQIANTDSVPMVDHLTDDSMFEVTSRGLKELRSL